jgi:ArsR family transcriptional regulator
VKGERSGERCLCLGETNVVAPEEVAENLDSAGGFESLKARLPPQEIIDRKAYSYKALADPIRIKILWSLSFCDMCPCVLKEMLEMTDSKLSYHLNILENAGQIECRKEKNWRIYSLTDKGRSSLER